MRRLLYGPFDILTKPNSMWTLLQAVFSFCVYYMGISALFLFFLFFSQFLSPLVFLSISMFSSCLWAFVDSARSCGICHQLGRGDEFLGPGHFFSSFKNGAETHPTPFSFPSALSSGGFRLYHPKLHIRERLGEREMRLLRVSYSIYYILWPRNPVDDTSLIVPTVPQGIGSPFFFLSQTPPKKNQKWCQGNSAPSAITLISWRYYTSKTMRVVVVVVLVAVLPWNDIPRITWLH